MTADPVSQQVQTNVTIDSARGAINFLDPFTQRVERLALLDESFLQSLFERLQSPDRIDALGSAWGRQFYSSLNAGIRNSKDGSLTPPESLLKEEFTEMLNGRLSYSGLGQFRITEANVFYVIDLRNSFAASASSEMGPRINRLVANFFSGLFSELSGKPLACVSISSQPTADRNLFALCLAEKAVEITDWVHQGKTDLEILAETNNTHIL